MLKKRGGGCNILKKNRVLSTRTCAYLVNIALTMMCINLTLTVAWKTDKLDLVNYNKF